MIVQTPRGMPPPGATNFKPTAFSNSTVLALAAYADANASTASGVFSLSSAAVAAPNASAPSAAAAAAASTVSLTFSISASGAQAFAAASAPAVLAGVQGDVAAALGVPAAWVSVTIGASAVAAGRRLVAVTTYSYIASVAVPSGVDVGTLAALNTGLAAISSASAASLASVLTSTIAAFAAENGNAAPTVAAAASVAQNGAACAAPCAVVVPTAAVLSTVLITFTAAVPALALDASGASALTASLKADIAANLGVPASWITVAIGASSAVPPARRLDVALPFAASIAVSDASFFAGIDAGLASLLAASSWAAWLSQAAGSTTLQALNTYLGNPSAIVFSAAVAINGVACAAQCVVTFAASSSAAAAAAAPFPAGAIAGVVIGALLLMAAIAGCQRHFNAHATAARAAAAVHKDPVAPSN
jgi:hypothetical protein